MRCQSSREGTVSRNSNKRGRRDGPTSPRAAADRMQHSTGTRQCVCKSSLGALTRTALDPVLLLVEAISMNWKLGLRNDFTLDPYRRIIMHLLEHAVTPIGECGATHASTPGSDGITNFGHCPW